MSDLKNDTTDFAELADETTDEELSENASHHHHHHHRHHSKFYYKYRKRKHKIKKYFRKHKVFSLCLMLLLLAAVISVSVLAGRSAKTSEQPDPVLPVQQQNDDFVSVRFPSFNEPKALVNDVVLKYIQDDSLTPLYNLVQTIDKQERLDGEKRMTISFSLSNLPPSVKVTEAVIDVAEDENFRHSVVHETKKSSNSIELKYLKTGMRYYYRIAVKLDNGSVVQSSGHFDTAESPRLISLDGVVNLRDIGGWKTTDGKRIKQGLLYRGPELDQAFTKSAVLQDSGVSDVHKYLGIVSDFDLRGLNGDVPTDSALGMNVEHRVYDVYDYVYALRPTAKDSIQQLFSDLADKNNYPIYMHCVYGKDRTGTMCFILEALLGLSDYDLIREFELSTLAYRDSNIREEDGNFAGFLKEFYSLEGKNAQEKAENYLLSCGVTQAQIDSIREILLEDVSEE